MFSFESEIMEELHRLALFMADQVGIYFFLLFSVCLWMHTCHGSIPTGDSLKPGDILNHTTKLWSARNIFYMGFVSFGDPDFTYLKIKNEIAGQIAWIGNRNEPLINNSGVLTLDDCGALKIIPKGETGKPIKVLYSPTRPVNNTVATLLDSGNLVLRQLHPNGSTMSVLWQSFDYPTNRLFSGMKLGVNHKTGHIWSLVSWITGDNPASGAYRLEWESKSAELIIRARGLIYWKSGSCRNNKPFPNISEKILGFYNFTVVSNEEEDYITFTPRNKSDDEISNWHLAYTGSLDDGITGEYIARADKCDGFNEDGGCQKLKNMSACRSTGVKLVPPLEGYINFTDINPNVEYLKNDTNPRLTKVDCWQRCWSNCDFVGFNTIYDNKTGCTFLLRNALDVITYTIHPDEDESWGTIYVLKGPLHHHAKKKWIWRSIVIATSLLIICLFILCLALRKRRIILEERKRKSTQAMKHDLQTSKESTSASYLQEETNKGHDLRIFSYESVIEATNHFSSENKLGQGGFGPVYKGVLPTSKEVAIKRLSTTSQQGVIEFKNELILICELRHINLVHLLGCCIHKEERMLIYEYMPNKSLDFFLFDPTRSKLLDWEKRFIIIEGIAQGLLYLHKYSRLKVIHRDLKASNILLDENMNPKISDFGMARMFTQQDAEVNTQRIVGTFGYMPPEYAMEGIFSTKSDVYSFGVLLLEIVSGRRNNSFYNANYDGPLNLIGYVWDLWENGVALQLIDPSLEDSYVHEEVLRCIHIGILCVEENAHNRPTMSNIISFLTDKKATLPSPRKPALLHVQRNILEGTTSSKESYNTSACKTSLSLSNSR